jgi:aminocarboxymuconate-semialdehyde decarboxylase
MSETIDSHAHVLTQQAVRLLAEESPNVAPVFDERAGTLTIAGSVVQTSLSRALFDTELRLRDMDEHNIDMQVLAPTVFTFFYGHDAALAHACSAVQNEEIAGLVRRYPERFLGLGTVPLQAPERAADELKRVMTGLGLSGAMVGSNVNGRNLDDPVLEPFWAMAAELNAFIFIHPHAGAAAERLKSYYLRNLVGLPFETTIAAAALVFGGVLKRYPKLKVCLSHGGGFVPYQAGRFCHGYRVRPETKVHLDEPPEASLARLYFDTILHSHNALAFLVGSVGPERVLLGSDYPFDMGNLDCVGRVEALDIAPADRALILGGCARRCLTPGGKDLQ